MSYSSTVRFIQRLRDEGHPIRVHGHQLPDGDYDGEWIGFKALVTIGEDRYQMETNLGTKGEGIACVVNVNNGKVLVSAREDREGNLTVVDESDSISADDYKGFPPAKAISAPKPDKGGWVKRDPNAADEAP